MPTPEAQHPALEADARIAEISDRLIELYVRRDEARRNANWQEVHDLQNQIEEMAAERNKLGLAREFVS